MSSDTTYFVTNRYELDETIFFLNPVLINITLFMTTYFTGYKPTNDVDIRSR